MTRINELNIIFNDNFIFKQQEEDSQIYNFVSKPIDFEYIPIAGGYYNSTLIKSFWVTKDCVTIYYFKKFVDEGGYTSSYYWSEEGNNWRKAKNITKPMNWYNYDGNWFINNKEIDDIENFPITNINYYEAEACCRYYNGRLPKEQEWVWISTNRNKTNHPNGLNIDSHFTCSNLSEIKPINYFYNESLLGFRQLYGNAWEYTNTFEIGSYNQTFVCLKGGNEMIPNFCLNKDLSLLINKYDNNHSTGFRIVRN